jgi:hypothetical protein
MKCEMHREYVKYGTIKNAVFLDVAPCESWKPTFRGNVALIFWVPKCASEEKC